MAKNEIHARVTPEVMEEIRQWTSFQELPNTSATVRWLLDIAFKVVNDELEAQKKNDTTVRLIEEEYQVFFARCRDEYDPEDGQLYWFWFESEDKSSWRFDSDSPNNWCPAERFISREDAIRDCLRSKSNQVNSSVQIVATELPSAFLTKADYDSVIDW